MVDPEVEKHEFKFKENLKMLRFIAIRAKKNCLVKMCIRVS